MDIIEDLIRQKPHLEDPLRFYAKAVRFMDAIKELRLPSTHDLIVYPPEFTEQIVQRLVSVFDFPEGSLSPLKQALELGEVDFTRLPLLETPAFSLPYPEDDLTLLLFLLSRPYFQKMRETGGLDDRYWKEGRCPVCGARPSLSFIARDGRRQLLCSFCGTHGRYDPPGCPVCPNGDSARTSVFSFAGEEGVTIHVCEVCKSYVKAVDGDLLERMTPDLADLMSLPLDIVIQKKGYKRSSPNPIGMVRMSASG